MPACKNDSKRYYKGTEPSPKGNGWCAHAEKVGKRRKGRDGKMWQVKSSSRKHTTKRVKRWVRVKTSRPTRPKSKVKGGMLQCMQYNSSPYKNTKQTSEKDKDFKRLAELYDENFRTKLSKMKKHELYALYDKLKVGDPSVEHKSMYIDSKNQTRLEKEIDKLYTTVEYKK